MIRKPAPYEEMLSPQCGDYLKAQAKSVFGFEKLSMIGLPSGLESKASFEFLIQLYEKTKDELHQLLVQRRRDREFIDKRTLSGQRYNDQQHLSIEDAEYYTVLGEQDTKERIVIGPQTKDYMKGVGKPVAPIPEYLQGYHVTLFGPPDNEKMCINAMNAFHRKLANEPAIVDELLANVQETPKWGADSEDSKTPMHADLVASGVNLSKALDHDLSFNDTAKNITYNLADGQLAHAIKRFPGLALPCYFLFYNGNPMPLHLYDFAMHAFQNWHNPAAMVFYVPKLENEEEARYIKNLMQTTEELLRSLHPEYQMGTIRLMIVLENPRAVFRVNEIIDELHPYFVGASLGWHDYLASTARLFKNDHNYRIPVKADPDIVIKYIKASHDLLSDVVGARGGIKVGGMYGILPSEYNLESPSLQVTLYGYFRDVLTQLKRNLNGFWVAHPDFVRIGMAIIEAWKLPRREKLHQLVQALLKPEFAKEILQFIDAKDIEGLDRGHPLYALKLIVADVGESNIIANNHPDEIRYNVFQTLQYLTDWLSGNGCVALPTIIKDVPVRIMDDLATCERSRWEVWHEIHHGRFDLHQFLKIAHEELNFIRRDLSDEKKIVQVKWTEANAKWYPVALKLMIKLMTDERPPEFATEYLLPFTINDVRIATDPWQKIQEIDGKKFKMPAHIDRFNYYFEMCGELNFAKQMSQNLVPDQVAVMNSIMAFDQDQVLAAASFHGDIGQSKKTLDDLAKSEQAKVTEDESVVKELRELGKKYLEKFGLKFLISAKGKSGTEMLDLLKFRFQRDQKTEWEAAKTALCEITLKRMQDHPYSNINHELNESFNHSGVKGLQIALSTNGKTVQSLCFGHRNETEPVTVETAFEIASLSKTVGTAIALDIFEQAGISLHDSVDMLLAKYGSDFRLNNKNVQLEHLLNHTALNMHYVNGVPLTETLPDCLSLLQGNEKWGYEAAKVIHEPGTKFQYSGAGFVLLQYLVELVTKKPFSLSLNIPGLTIDHPENYAHGYLDHGAEVTSTRLQFPAIAAGMLASAQSVQRFLCQLGQCYWNLDKGIVSHNTAVRMLHGKDRGSKQFMNCLMGLGVFVAEAGDNRLMIHQGANDGYRALFLHCFAGPDRGKGFTLLANGELNAVLLNATVAQLLLKEFHFSGIDFTQFQSKFDFKNLKPEEMVNLGYKNLVFDAFIPNLPEKIVGISRKRLHNNVLENAEILSCTNQGFARAENVFSPFEPIFDPTAYGRQGKLMDSWESVRHNELGVETLHLKLVNPSDIAYGYISTKYHDGNHFESVTLLGFDGKVWREILPETALAGHSYRKIKFSDKFKNISEVKILAKPDGGLTRVRLYQSVENETEFNGNSVRFTDPIPVSHQVIKRKKKQQQAMKIISATNEHYGPAEQLISPFAPIDMFDGLENRRSRNKDNVEEVVIELFDQHKLHLIELDFTYFVNNNPNEIEIWGKGTDWELLVPRNEVKAFRANKIRYHITSEQITAQLKLRIFPDGGINRIYVY